MKVNKKKTTPKDGRKSINLPPDTIHILQKQADKQGVRSLKNYMECILIWHSNKPQ